MVLCSAHASQLYFGVSIAGWKKFFQNHGYRFITVDQNGVDAFFVDPQHFSQDFLEGIKGTHFKENFYQMRKFKRPWNEKFELIKDQPFFEI